MSASHGKNPQKVCAKIAFKYLLVSLLCALFGAVYEVFSHGVYAYGMLYAFAIPLLGGVLPSLLFALCGKRLPREASRLLWAFGVSALTVGSLFHGALQIYGTASELTVVYWIIGGLCFMVAVLIGTFVSESDADKVTRQ